MDRVLYSAILLLVMCQLLPADPPLTFPNVERTYIGLAIVEEPPTHAENRPVKAKPPRKGVFVDSASPRSPGSAAWNKIGEGALISKIEKTPIRSTDDFLAAIGTLEAGKEYEFEVSQLVLNKSKQPAWSTPKRVTISPVLYRDWLLGCEVTEQDSFLNKWTTIPAGSDSDNPADPHLHYEVDGGSAKNLQMIVTCFHDTPVYIKSIRVKVGEAIYNLPVKTATPRIGDRGEFVEHCSLSVEGKAVDMVRDLAFGSGECAIQFSGPKETSSWTVSEPGRSAFRETLTAYGLRGNPQILADK